MSGVAKTIHVPDDSELARLLQEADGAGLRLEQNGITYRVTREDDDLWAGYDPEAVRAGVEAGAGAITPEEAEALKAYVYRGRQEGTRPANRT
jgi:hypothetical protein